MPIFAQTISLSSALPPGALRDRIRALATGQLRLPPRSRWSGPVAWWLDEKPDATIRLMPLSSSDYGRRQPSFIGAIEPEGSGSRVSGRVALSAFAIWAVTIVLLLDAFITAGGVAQEISRHGLIEALPFALFGMVFAAAAVSMLRYSVSWAAAEIRQLLEAASSDPHHAIEPRLIRPTDAIVSETSGRSARGALVLRFAAALDLLLAAFLIASPVVSSRIGRPVTLLIAALLAFSAPVVLVIAHRLRNEGS
jgi:hypothetical protein